VLSLHQYLFVVAFASLAPAAVLEPSLFSSEFPLVHSECEWFLLLCFAGFGFFCSIAFE
jgi:hypothetical protein